MLFLGIESVFSSFHISGSYSTLQKSFRKTKKFLHSNVKQKYTSHIDIHIFCNEGRETIYSHWGKEKLLSLAHIDFCLSVIYKQDHFYSSLNEQNKSPWMWEFDKSSYFVFQVKYFSYLNIYFPIYILLFLSCVTKGKTINGLTCPLRTRIEIIFVIPFFSFFFFYNLI